MGCGSVRGASPTLWPEAGSCIPRSTSGGFGFGPATFSCSHSCPGPPAPLAGFSLDPLLVVSVAVDSVAAIRRVRGACHVIVAPLVAEHRLADGWSGLGAWRASRRRAAVRSARFASGGMEKPRPAAATAAAGRVVDVLSFNGRPGTRRGSRTPHRGAVLPVDAYSLAVACGSRGVSLDLWPASHSAPPRRALSVCPDTTGTAPRPARHVAPRRGSRHAGSCPAAALSPRLGGPPGRQLYASPPRATTKLAYGAFAMRRPPMLLRCSEALAQLLFAASTRWALRPGNVAIGDQCVRGTLAPRHHAGTNNLLSKALGATGRKAALAPRHYRIAAWSAGTPHRECDVPRRGGPAVTGRCASHRPPDENHHAVDHRLVGAGDRAARSGHMAPRVMVRTGAPLGSSFVKRRFGVDQACAETRFVQICAATEPDLTRLVQ